jgi:hypothetical protein
MCRLRPTLAMYFSALTRSIADVPGSSEGFVSHLIQCITVIELIIPYILAIEVPFILLFHGEWSQRYILAITMFSGCLLK